ncbi:MAG TPA: BamA/TamA family outer membrane protein [Polyangiaceae bacterium]|nr:BamA/TamA family outer membrane protein [Polyangiaceae bacterium]
MRSLAGALFSACGATLAFALPLRAEDHAAGDETAAAAETATSAISDADPEDAPTPSRSRIRYLLQGVEVRGNTRTRDRVVLRYVHFRAGDLLDVNDPELELTRYRLLGTSFFSSAQLSLRKGDRRGEVVLVIEVVERNTLVVNDFWMGLAGERTNKAGPPTGVYAYGGLDAAETNLAGTGITLGAAIGVGIDQLALRTRFFDPAFLGTGWMTSATLLYNNARDFFGNNAVYYQLPEGVRGGSPTTAEVPYAVVDYSRFGGSFGAGHDLGIATQLWFDLRVEKIHADLPLAASHLRGLDREPIAFNVIGGDSVLSTVRGMLIHDTRNEPILPTRGSYITVTADTALAPAGGDYGFTKLQIRASRWWTLPWKHVARLELNYGAITGDAPFFEKFYVGDFTDLLPDRVLDLNFDRRRAPNFLGTDISEVRYGDYAAKFQVEYRIPIYRGHRSVYGIDFFGAAGIYGVASYRDITDPPRGYHGFRKVPVDLTFNLGFRIDTHAGGFVFAFSNLVGLIPVRGAPGP